MKIVSVVAGTVISVTWALFILMAIWMLFLAPAFAADGKEIYTKSCATCHGPAGKGDGAAAAALNPKPQDLTNKANMSKLDDAYMSNIIAKGGSAVGKSPLMPPFNGQLKDQDVKNVIAYIRSLAK